MAPRAFTVFVDEPSSPPAVVDLPAAHEIAIAVAPPPSGPLLVYNPDKENINPATGQRASSEPLAKKRKTNVLATKLHVPPPAKKQKESKEGRKRARSDTVLKVVETSKPQEKKVKRSSSFKRTNSSAPSRARRSPSLPRLPEVAEEVETDKAPLALSQAQVDARCYELTVMPLADLSKAYEQAPSPTDHTAPTQFEKSSQELEEQLVAPTELERVASPVPSSTKDDSRSPSPSAAQRANTVFTTPERKRIYSAFTFRTPSPSGKRYAMLRGSSVDRFSDPDYDFRS